MRHGSRPVIGPLARPHIDALSHKVGLKPCTSHSCDHGQVLYVDKRNAMQPVEMYSDAGKVGPAYCTGVGKAMLAFLPESQQLGASGTAKLSSLYAAHLWPMRKASKPSWAISPAAATPMTGKSMSRASSASQLPILSSRAQVCGWSVGDRLRPSTRIATKNWTRSCLTFRPPPADASRQMPRPGAFPLTSLNHPAQTEEHQHIGA